MPSCVQCGKENPKGAKFCIDCGVELERSPANQRPSRKRLLLIVMPILIVLCVVVGLCTGPRDQEAPKRDVATAKQTRTQSPSRTPSPTRPPAATRTAVSTATATPSPSPVPSLTPSPACPPDATFAADVSIPDGTAMAPGTQFTKIWRISCSGCAAWESGTRLVFISGDQMGAPDSVLVPKTEKEGTADIAVEMEAPATARSYEGVWRMQDPHGELFGDNVYVLITVSQPGAVAAVPTAPPGRIEIVHIHYKGQQGTTEPDEYAEIKNSGGTAVNLKGWTLNAGAPEQDFRFPSFELQPGQSIRVYTNEVHPESGGFSFRSKKALWNNSGDCGYLMDASGAQIHKRCY